MNTNLRTIKDILGIVHHHYDLYDIESIVWVYRGYNVTLTRNLSFTQKENKKIHVYFKSFYANECSWEKTHQICFKEEGGKEIVWKSFSPSDF